MKLTARSSVIVLGILVAFELAAQQRTVNDFFNDFTARWVRGNANQAVSTRYFTGDEQNRLEQQLTPDTLEYRKGRIQLAKQGLTELAKFDRAKMTPAQRQSAELMQWQLEIVTQSEPYLDYSFPLEQNGGVNVNLPNTLIVNHPLRNENDAAHYIARLKLVATRMEEALTEARRLASKNMIPPRFIIQATITQMQQFIGTPPAQNPFVATFAERMAAVQSIPAARREQFRSEAEKVVGDQVYPAWRTSIAFLESLLPRSNDDAGMWRFKGGDEAYAYNLRRFTSTKLTPDQIHQIGLDQVARLEKEMDTILRRLGRTNGSVKDRIAKLRDDLAYPLTEDGRKAIMVDVEQMLRDSERRSKLLFDKTPKAPVVAQPYPRFREANAAASYNAPPLDGSRPGTFQIPLRNG